MQTQSIIPQKSPNDKRSYQAMILQNKIKILFIQDEETSNSACAISVGVGSLLDKDRSLGLAHFLQHMLFMGSKKYPQHNQYSSFISKNSGFDNAFTKEAETNYYFQIKNSGFYQATQRLTNFFNGALLNGNCIQKQSQAVHQQYVLWCIDDSCRKLQIIRKLGSGPYSRFSIGNVDTLRHESIRDDLVQFYEKYYSANIINAVVCSNQKIQDMKKIIIPFFQAIPNKNIQPPKYDLHFTKQQTGKFLLIQTIKDQTMLQFYFIVQNLKPLYKKHVSDYIQHILAHQGKNSLCSILKQKNYASQVNGFCQNIKTQSLLGVCLKLTQQGQKVYQQVYNITMDFFASLKANKDTFQQIKQKKLIGFQFSQKQQVSQYVSKLASDLHYVPIQQILNNEVLFDQYDQNCINRVLQQLTPCNVFTVLSSSKELQNPQIEKYLGGKYLVKQLPQRKKSNIIFQQIPKNIFIPIDKRIFKNQCQQKILTPTKIHQNIYFLHENTFNICKGGIQLRIYNKQDTQFMQFYANYINALIKQFTYPAETVNCRIQFSSDNAVVLSIFGFNDTVIKVIQLFADEIKNIHDGKKSQILFGVSLQNLIQKYQNTFSQKSSDISQGALTILLQKSQITVQQSIKQLKSYQYKQITNKIKQFWKNNIFNWIVVGNFEQKNIAQILSGVQQKIRGQCKDLKLSENGCLKLTQNLTHQIFLQSQQLNTSCTIVYYQFGPYSEQLYYKLLLLKNHIEEPFFNQLRTLKQMAYYLTVKILNTRGVLGLYFILVSSTRDPKNISDEIKTFVNSFFGKLNEDLTGDNAGRFATLKESVFTKINAPHDNILALFQFIMREVIQKTFYYTRKQEPEIRKYLTTIEVSDLEKIWCESKNNTLQIYVVSKAHEQEYLKNNVKAESIESIKSRSEFWKDFFQCN